MGARASFFRATQRLRGWVFNLVSSIILSEGTVGSPPSSPGGAGFPVPVGALPEPVLGSAGLSLGQRRVLKRVFFLFEKLFT